MAESPLLAVRALSKQFHTREPGKWFARKRRVVNAVSDVSFEMRAGEVLGIVGESGSGKTTVSRMLLRLIEPTSGVVEFKGRNIFALSADEVRSQLRPAMRMVFQDPDAALNPAYSIGTGLARAIRLHALGGEKASRAMVIEHLERLGMDGSFADKYPDELSGGEKRRIGICRALLTNPDVIVADEPLSGLDVVLQERVLELLKREQLKRGFALILVSHDLDRVNQICDKVLVMHGGRVAEELTLRRGAAPLREQYRHPYSIILQQARLDTGDARTPVRSDVDVNTDASLQGMACTFAFQCPRRLAKGAPDVCVNIAPPLAAVSHGHSVACHFPLDVAEVGLAGGTRAATLLARAGAGIGLASVE